MEDREVGELWMDIWRDVDPVGEHGGCRDSVIALIRKLVEERKTYYYKVERCGDAECRIKALRDFNIDPDEWEDCP